MRRARAEAERLDLNFFDADSLLLGLLGERRCLAVRALTRLGLDPQQARRELEARVSDAAYRQSRMSPDSLMPTAYVRSREETKARGQVCGNTADLLLGVLHDTASAAAQVLAVQGLAVEAVQAALRDVAAQDAAAEGGEAVVTQKGPSDWLREMRDPLTDADTRWASLMQLSVALTVGNLTVGTAHLDAIAAEAVPVLIDLLHDPDEKLRVMAATALGQFGPAARSAAPALAEALADRADVRAAAAEALSHIEVNDADFAGRLARGLEDRSAQVRVASAKALWNATQDVGRVLPVLLAGLTDADAEVRHKAASDLGELGAAAADVIPALIAALQDPDEQVRFHALDALRKIGAPARAAVPALIGLLRDPSPLVNSSAGAVLIILAEHAAESLPDLLAALADPDPRLRSCAATALGQLRPVELPVITALKQRLTDPDVVVRVHAAAALWKLEQREGLVPVLIEAVNGPDAMAAGIAMRTLTLMGAAALPALVPLRAALASTQMGRRVEAALALVRLGQPFEPLLPVFTAALADTELATQLSAAMCLGELGPLAKPAVPVLLEAYHQHDDWLCEEIKKALQKIDPELCLQADEPILAPAEPGQAGSRSIVVHESRSTAAEALEDWSEAIRSDPDDIQALRCRAGLYEKLKDWRHVAGDWTEVIRLAAEDIQAHMHRGQALRELGEYDRSAADFTFVIGRQPDNADAYNNRAIAHKRKGDHRQAIADYSEAIRLDPHRPGFYRNRSLAFKAMKDYVQAATDLAAALVLDPEHAATHNDMGWFRATCPDPAFRDGTKAVVYARRGCELSGWSTPGFLNTLAAAYAEAGQFDEAVRWANNALEHPERLTPAQVEEFTGHLRLYEQGKSLCT
jgi:HEAT repeat protein